MTRWAWLVAIVMVTIGVGAANAATAQQLAALVKGGSIPKLVAYLATRGVSINDRPDDDKALLDYAAEQNQVVIALYLLDHGALVNAEQTKGLHQGVTALDRAAFFGSTGVAQLLMAHGADVNARDRGGDTPLMYAAVAGRQKMAALLLAHGANLTEDDRRGRVAIYLAAQNGHVALAKYLENYRPGPPPPMNPQALIQAAADGNLDGVRYLVTRNPTQEALDTALRFAVMATGNGRPQTQPQLVQLLLAHGANPNAHDEKNWSLTPLMLTRSSTIARLLIAHGADVNAVTTPGGISAAGEPVVAALACSPALGDPVAVVKLLVAHGAKLAVGNPKTQNALDCAARSGNTNLVTFLISHGLPATTHSEALFATTNPAVARVLVRNGAHLNVTNAAGLTPLANAVAHGQNAYATALIELGAHSSVTLSGDQSALMQAVNAHNSAAVQTLLEHGANANVAGNLGISALDRAARAGDTAIVRLLVEHGADVNPRLAGRPQLGALDYAAQRNDATIVSLLLAHDANPKPLTKGGLRAEAYATSLPVRKLLTPPGEPTDTMAEDPWDKAACNEVLQRANAGTLDAVLEPGTPPPVPGDPSEDWDYYGQVATESSVKLGGHLFRVGFANDLPLYVARVGADGAEEMVCEYQADTSRHPAALKIITRLERLQARGARDIESLSTESLKVVGLAGAEALLEASRRAVDPLPLTQDSDANILSDAVMAHRGDVLAFYLDHGVDPNITWVPHTGPRDPSGFPDPVAQGSPLYTAVRYGSTADVLTLFAHGVDPNDLGSVPPEPVLSWAIQNAAPERVALLLDHGADPTIASTSSYTASITVRDVSRNRSRANEEADAIRLVLLHGGDPNVWIWWAFQTLAGEKHRDDLVTAADATRPSFVKTAWIQSLVDSGGAVDQKLVAILTEAVAIRDSKGCPGHPSSAELSECLPNSLRVANQALNTQYAKLTGSGNRETSHVRADEREWLSERDQRCGLKEPAHLTEGGWLSYVLADQARAVCVLKLTRRRIDQLTNVR